jgi:hypothetical protein
MKPENDRAPRLPTDGAQMIRRDAMIIPLRPFVRCAGCGVPFVARRVSHRYCSRCYRLGTAGALITRAATLLREA